jgi:hypothetical protein
MCGLLSRDGLCEVYNSVSLKDYLLVKRRFVLPNYAESCAGESLSSL